MRSASPAMQTVISRGLCRLAKVGRHVCGLLHGNGRGALLIFSPFHGALRSQSRGRTAVARQLVPVGCLFANAGVGHRSDVAAAHRPYAHVVFTRQGPTTWRPVGRCRVDHRRTATRAKSGCMRPQWRGRPMSPAGWRTQWPASPVADRCPIWPTPFGHLRHRRPVACSWHSELRERSPGNRRAKGPPGANRCVKGTHRSGFLMLEAQFENPALRRRGCSRWTTRITHGRSHCSMA